MQKYSVDFLLHRKSKTSESFYVLCRVRWSGQTLEFSLGYVVDKDKWDAASQECKPRTLHGRHKTPASVINAEIRHTRDVVDKVFTKHLKAGVWPGKAAVEADVKAQLRNAPVEDFRTPFSVAYQQYLTDGAVTKGWKEGTIKKLRTARTHITQCGLFPSLDSFSDDNLAGYVAWLRSERNMRDVSIFKQIGYLKWFLAWCDERGMLSCTDYRRFKPRLHKSTRPVVFLTWDELMKLWSFSGTPFENEVRDIFCFCAFTSLRFSDALNLRWFDITDDVIHVTTLKTDTDLKIELNKWSREVLSRHKSPDPSAYVFPRMTNQAANRDLKTICKKLELFSPIRMTYFKAGERVDEVEAKYKYIGTHAARRTFICNALRLGISPTTVMQWTGHSNYNSMKPYIAVADDEKKKAMSLFDN